MTKPTIGRVVYFRPQPSVNPGLIHAAIVAAVFTAIDGGPAVVNLAVFNEDGTAYSRQSVPFRETFDERNDSIYSDIAFAHWMPYQRDQQARLEPQPVSPAEVATTLQASRAEGYSIELSAAQLPAEVTP
jgi:hypothetical protein